MRLLAGSWPLLVSGNVVAVGRALLLAEVAGAAGIFGGSLCLALSWMLPLASERSG